MDPDEDSDDTKLINDSQMQDKDFEHVIIM